MQDKTTLMKSSGDITYLSLLSDAFGFSMLRVLFRKTSKNILRVGLGVYERHSVTGWRGEGGAGGMGVNVNAYLSICLKSVSRPTQ